METEQNALNGRTWVELRLTARTHGLPFNTSIPKAASRARLAAQLGTGGFARAIRRLTARERRGLLALQAAGGSMPRHRFTAHYGTIRPIRQRQPLPSPPTAAERLWRLGLIEIERDPAGRGERVMLPPAILDLLPPLPQPREALQPSPSPYTSVHTGAPTDEFSRADFLGDLAAWFGSVMALAPRVTHGRWLSPLVLRAINGRLFQPEPLDGIRSERDTGKLRFIHYLAEAAGFVAPVGETLTLTPAAWAWLDLPPEQAWDTLWSALERERSSGGELWMRYRLPDIPPEVWAALVSQLGALPPGRYDGTSFVEALRPFCPPDWDDDEGWDDEPITPLASRVESWLNAVFAPCGWARWRGDGVEIAPRTTIPPQFARLTYTDDAISDDPIKDGIHIRLSPHLPRRALVDILTIATLDESGLHSARIDADAVERASERGISALQIAEMVAAGGSPIPAAWLERLQAWERAAKGVTIQRLTVITASDPALLDGIRADRRLRKWTAESLSAHHLVVQPGKAEAVAKALRRKGVKVRMPQSRPSMGQKRTSSGGADAYGYLMAKIVSGLGDFIPLPFRIPSAARDEWAMSLTPHKRDDLDHIAASVLDALARAMSGFPPPSPVQPEHPDAIQTTIRAAYDERRAVTIEYFSPARGALTRRRIAPTRWYDLNGATYIEAWCELDDAARAFRLDRVLRVLDEPSDEPLDKPP